MQPLKYIAVGIVSLVASIPAAPGATHLTAASTSPYRSALTPVSWSSQTGRAVFKSPGIPGLTVVGTLRGALPHAFDHLHRVGSIRAVRIPKAVPNGGGSDTMVSPWGILSISRVPAGYRVTLTTWQGKQRLLLRWKIHPTPAQLSEGPLLSFAVGGNPAGVWSTGRGVPLTVLGQGSTEFLWWNLTTGSLMPIRNPAGPLTAANVNYPDIVSTAADWILTWSETGRGEAWSFTSPSKPAQALPAGFQAGVGVTSGIFGWEKGAPNGLNTAVVYNLHTRKFGRPRVQPDALFHQVPGLAHDSAVLEELWLPQWGPSYVAIPIHENLEYPTQSVPVVQASGRHRIDLQLTDGTVLVGNGFLVNANWKTHEFSIGYPNAHGVWRWHTGGAATPASLMVYAGGVSWHAGGATWIWQAPST